jgi:hypothetical protein
VVAMPAVVTISAMVTVVSAMGAAATTSITKCSWL